MTKRIFYLILTVFLWISGLNACAEDFQTFTLKGVRSHEEYGPFPFRRGTVLKLETGIFRLGILADNKAFTLTDTENGLVYGAYELVLSRMIDIGDALFTITGVTAPSIQAAVMTAPSFFDNSEIAIDISLINEVAYNWEINGVSGGEDQNMERRIVTLKARKGLFTIQSGIFTESKWNNTIEGSSSTFIDAEISGGSGWFAGAGLSIPILKEGRWSAHINGEVTYRREELELAYGTWEIASIISTVDTVTTAPGTNDVSDPTSSTNLITVTNSVTTTTKQPRFSQYTKNVTLTETLVSVSAQIAYHAPAWFLYAGVKALPWSETTLSAVITSDDKKYKLTFARKDPVMAYGGVGLDFFGLRSYIEIEGGGENAVRLGISRAF